MLRTRWTALTVACTTAATFASRWQNTADPSPVAAVAEDRGPDHVTAAAGRVPAPVDPVQSPAAGVTQGLAREAAGHPSEPRLALSRRVGISRGQSLSRDREIKFKGFFLIYNVHCNFFFLCAFFTMHFVYVILQCKKYCYKYKVLNYKVDLKKFVHCPAIIGVKTGLSRGESPGFISINASEKNTTSVLS